MEAQSGSVCGEVQHGFVLGEIPQACVETDRRLMYDVTECRILLFHNLLSSFLSSCSSACYLFYLFTYPSLMFFLFSSHLNFLLLLLLVFHSVILILIIPSLFSTSPPLASRSVKLCSWAETDKKSFC